MKRFSGFVLILTLLFSFSACAKKLEGAEISAARKTSDGVQAAVRTKSQTLKKTFKDANGRTVFLVETEIPRISGLSDEKLEEQINRRAREIFDDACVFAERNVKNAASFMDVSGSETPWTKKADFEVSYSGPRFLCFVVKEYFSCSKDPPELDYSTLCFDLKRRELCSAIDFVKAPTDSSVLDKVLLDGLILKKAESDFGEEAGSFSSERRAALKENFGLANFYITENSICFYFNGRSVFPESGDDVYVCELAWDEVSEVFFRPDEFSGAEPVPAPLTRPQPGGDGQGG